MKNLKELCIKLITPPKWLMLILTLISTAGLIVVFIIGLENTIIAYIIYALSAYTLTADCFFMSKVIPRSYNGIKTRVHNHPIGNRYMTDVEFKVRISLYVSLGINFIYSIFKLISGIIFSSFWWGAEAIYYILLSLLRFLLLKYIHTNTTKKGIIHEYRHYRLCGIMMLALNTSLTGIMFQLVRDNRSYSYPGILIYVAATYTFYAVTISIVDIVQYRKYKSPILSASKAIRFAAALVSLLSLETAMLAQFGSDELFRKNMVTLTSIGVYAIILTVSIYMIIHSTLEIKKKERQKIAPEIIRLTDELLK